MPPAPLRRAAPALLATLLAAAPAAAQDPRPRVWSVQPFGGMFLDAYDVGADDRRSGGLLGVEVARRIAPRLRGVATVAYARVHDVGGRDPGVAALHVRAHEWVFAAAGPALDVPVRGAVVSLSLQAGAAWRRTPVVGILGRTDVDPVVAAGAGDFALAGAVIPGIAVRIPMSPRVALAGGASLFATSLDDRRATSPAFSLGVAYAP